MENYQSFKSFGFIYNNIIYRWPKKKKKKQVRKKLCEANFPQTQVEGMNTTTSENKFDSKGVNTNLKDRN